ncbi:hypothetical protein [Sphingomonas sp.]|jgi:hypothetical protein|uniref:hypothetical protein n=1 Tax=Sphingomonas sp. TaxID=28214 RepID=UPI002D7F7AB0|nr:hypothetical protein [Sphingomonas sp.]HEU0045126.1 hypothetical protein [Sphingomonas sp.]
MTESPRPDPIPFTPVPTASTRHDGWTPQRQRQFIRALAAMGVVAAAARAVGKSATAAYNLRARPGAEEFAGAWDIALNMGQDRAFELAVDRAINGYHAPRYYRGREVGTVHRFDMRLAMAALRGRQEPAAEPLSAEQQAQVAWLLGDVPGPPPPGLD